MHSHIQNSNPFKQCAFIVIFTSLVNDDCIVWLMHSAQCTFVGWKLEINEKQKLNETKSGIGNHLCSYRISFSKFVQSHSGRTQKCNTIRGYKKKIPFADLTLSECCNMNCVFDTGYNDSDTWAAIISSVNKRARFTKIAKIIEHKLQLQIRPP